MFDFRIFMRGSLMLVGAIGMMAAGYLDGTANEFGRYHTMFQISFWVFLIGLAFSATTHSYWLKAAHEEIERM